MNFTVYCTDCGLPLAKSEDGAADEESVICSKCGARIEFHVRNDIARIWLLSYASMLFPDEKRRFKINCPVCGKRIANSANGTDTETPCPKCGAIIRHEIQDDTAYVRVEKYVDKQPLALRK